MRVHYVARLKAIDTSEKDRAVSDLEKAKRGYRYTNWMFFVQPRQKQALKVLHM